MPLTAIPSLTPDSIRFRRERMGLPQELFGRLLGVSYQTVHQIESGRRRPTALQERLLVMTDFLHLTVPAGGWVKMKPHPPEWFRLLCLDRGLEAFFALFYPDTYPAVTAPKSLSE